MRKRQHVNPLGRGFETFRGSRPALVPGWPVELEIGCADAQFLFERARVQPLCCYVGIEIRDQLVREVNARAHDERVPVQGVFCNANNHLTSLFAPASVSRVFLNFPDPWFKKRHHKRRMVTSELLRDCHALLRPDGELFFQSDVWDVALETMELAERLDRLFCNAAGEWSFWREGNPFGARSWRERHCQEHELPIWRLRYRVKTSASPNRRG